MRRWIYALGATLLACLAIVAVRGTGDHLLNDSDCAYLLYILRTQPQAWTHWFASDWPLGNHFYRPLPTLTFMADQAMYGVHGSSYGWTNALLAIGCVVALFWFLRELLDNVAETVIGCLLFVSWQSTNWALSIVSQFISLLTLATLVWGAWRHRLNVRRYLPAVLLLLLLNSQIYGMVPLQARVVDWLVGRTASVMTLFALLAMASYTRGCRLRPGPSEPVRITPLTPPATRTTKISTVQLGKPFGWELASVLFAVAAFASYEQAVMLPACLLGVALTMRWKGFRPQFGWMVPMFGLIAGYLLLRHAVIPAGNSSYQAQQLRTGPGVMLSLFDYLFPPLNNLRMMAEWFSSSALIFITLDPWLILLNWATWTTSAYQLRREWILALAGWGLSFLAFLPMAWVKLFEHYYYWPMALRTIFVIAIGRVAWELVATAWCRREQPAPQRSAPAPGSLPRP